MKKGWCVVEDSGVAAYRRGSESTCSRSVTRASDILLATLPQFVIMRGGEYGFLPSLSALRWLGELNR